MNRHAYSPLFDPHSLVVIAERPLPVGATLPARLAAATTWAEHDFLGRLTLPATLNGVVAGERLDLALISVPGGRLGAALALLEAHRPRAAIVHTREPSAALTAACRAWAESHDCALMGPHAFGLQRPQAGLNASLHPVLARPGRVAVVAQSHSIMAAMMDWADDTQTGFSAVVAPGSEAVIDAAAILDFLASDPYTDSIALYLENIRDAREFMSALRAAASVKPVVVLKPGRNDQAERLFPPVTGTSGERSPSALPADMVCDAALRRAGALRVHYFMQLFSTVKALGYGSRPRGRRIAIIANGSGPARLALDLMTPNRFLACAQLAADTRGALVRLLSPAARADNPVIEFAPLDVDTVSQTLHYVTADAGVDGVLLLLAPDADSDLAGIASHLAQAVPQARKPIITCLMGDASMRPLRRLLAEAGVPTFRTPETAADAFGQLASHHYNQQLLLQTQPPEPLDEPADLTTAQAVIDAVRADGRTELTADESQRLLAAFRVNVATVPAHADTDTLDGALGAAVKLASSEPCPAVSAPTGPGTEPAPTRTTADAQASAANALTDPAAEPASAPRLRTTGLPPATIQIARDALFGPVIRLDESGAWAQPTSAGLELPPLNGFLARRLIERSRWWRTLLPQATPMALDALENLLIDVAEVATELPDVESVVLEPVTLDDQGPRIARGRVVLTARPSGLRAGTRHGHPHLTIAPYPTHWVSDCQFSDGTPWALRPIRPEDAEPLQAFIRGLSAQARYMRFISAMRELPPRMLARYTQVDYHRELALLGTTMVPNPDHRNHPREVVIGVAHYLRNPDGISAEYALVIGDDWQRRGLGKRLMTALIEAAREQGLHYLEGVVLTNNKPMLKLMTSLGFVNDADPEDPSMRSVWLKL